MSSVVCELCQEEMCAQAAFYYENVCDKCATRIANQFSLWHSGKYLTWPNDQESSSRNIKKQMGAKIRKAVFERDAYRCTYCGGHKDLELDHVIPESRGGETSVANLTTACQPCNRSKHARTPQEWKAND